MALRAVKPSSSTPADPSGDLPNIPSIEDDAVVWQSFWRDNNIEYVPTYIAGGRSVQKGRNWRMWCEERLPIIGFDPFRDSQQNALYQFVTGDINAVIGSKLVLAYYPGGYASHGMAAEIGYAAALGIPVFYVDESEAPDLFLVGLSKRFFPSLEALSTWWARRIANGVPVP